MEFVPIADEDGEDMEQAEFVPEPATFQSYGDVEAALTRRLVLVAKLEKLDEQYQRMRKPLADMLARWEDQNMEGLRLWALHQTEGRKSRFVDTLMGRLSLRRVGAGFVVADKEAAEKEALARGVVKTSPDLSAYRKLAEETGELLPGIEMRPERDSLSIAGRKGE